MMIVRFVAVAGSSSNDHSMRRWSIANNVCPIGGSRQPVGRWVKDWRGSALPLVVIAVTGQLSRKRSGDNPKDAVSRSNDKGTERRERSSAEMKEFSMDRMSIPFCQV
jgi:hypothetical protein